MYEALIETLKTYILGSAEEENKKHLNGKDNVLTNSRVKIVSNGNITFEGKYITAQILEKKKSLQSNS